MRRLMAIVGTLLCLAMFLTACGSSGGDTSSSGGGGSTSEGGESSTSDAASLPDGPLKIGMPIALSGPISAYDLPNKTGAELVAKKINAEGGVDGHEIELLFADTKGEVAQGATAALEVINDGAQFVITTPDYDLGGAAARIATKKGLITMSSAGDLRFGLDLSPNLFNLFSGAPTEGAVMAEYAVEKLGWKSAYTLTDTVVAHSKDACGAFEKAFEERGGTISGADTFDSTSQSVAPQITRLRQSNSDGFALCSLVPGGPSALRQIRAAGIDTPVILDTGFDTNVWEKSVPNIGEAHVVSGGVATPGQDPDPKTAALFKEAEEATGEETSFTLGLLTGSSAVEAMADAAGQLQTTDGEVVQEYLQEYVNHPLAIGPTTWTAECHLAAGRPMLITRIEDNKLQYVETIKPKSVPQPDC